MLKLILSDSRLVFREAETVRVEDGDFSERSSIQDFLKGASYKDIEVEWLDPSSGPTEAGVDG